MLVAVPGVADEVTTTPVFNLPKLRYFCPAPSMAAEGGSPPGQLLVSPAVPSTPSKMVKAWVVETRAVAPSTWMIFVNFMIMIGGGLREISSVP